jgi:hypothetical protein
VEGGRADVRRRLPGVPESGVGRRARVLGCCCDGSAADGVGVPDTFDDAAAGEADGDASADADADADVGPGTCWTDPTTGFVWEDPPSDRLRSWDDAVSYCNGLSLCGYAAGAWRLPTISELRSLIRGCARTTTAGACGVTDSCLDVWTCYSMTDCDGCHGVRPGPSGCYWDAAVRGSCVVCWSSSVFVFESVPFAWWVDFDSGSVSNYQLTFAIHVRCVHNGP